MNSTRSPLIQKLITGETKLTPYEAIHLKYLSEKGTLEALIDVEKQTDPYKFAREARGSISPYFVGFMIQWAKDKDPDLFRSYNKAYEALQNEDKYSAINGFKGLTLLTQISLMRQEHSNHTFLSREYQMNKLEIIKQFQNTDYMPVTDFESYSFIHQKYVPFMVIVASLGHTFRYLYSSIDNILTLNYYLDKMVDIEDLQCLQYLKMWLNDGTANLREGEKPFFNGAEACCEQKSINIVLDKNHNNFVNHIGEFIPNLPASFAENSLQYVKDITNQTISSVKKIKN